MRRLALYHLETLLWISRLGTFGAAAERLNTTQPAISARVREIESQLGIAIFRREGRRMVLTVRGRQLVRDCEPLWATIERTFLEADGFAGASGVVRIGSGEIAAASCLPGFMREIKEALPGVTIEIALDLIARLLEQLLAGVSDIVFLAGPVASPGIRTQSIGMVELLWLASPQTAPGMGRFRHCLAAADLVVAATLAAASGDDRFARRREPPAPHDQQLQQCEDADRYRRCRQRHRAVPGGRWCAASSHRAR